MKKFTKLMLAATFVAGATGVARAETSRGADATQSSQSGVVNPQSTQGANTGAGATSADASMSVSGRVTNVDAGNESVMIRQDSGEATSLSIPDSARVLKADGSMARLEDVKSGQRVTATQDGEGQVTELRINKAS